MSEQIKPGDMVQVVRPSLCCGCEEGLGHVFVVVAVERAYGECNACKLDGVELVAMEPGCNDEGYPLGILRRIPPLAELEAERAKEDLREPA